MRKDYRRARGRRDERDGGRIEVRSSRLSELRTPNFELRTAPFWHVSRFTFHGPWALADFFQHPVRSTVRFVTLLAIHDLSEMLSPAFLCHDPGPIRHRWLVTHVLTMAAL